MNTAPPSWTGPLVKNRRPRHSKAATLRRKGEGKNLLRAVANRYLEVVNAAGRYPRVELASGYIIIDKQAFRSSEVIAMCDRLERAR
jgi:hypothetical protein